MQVYNGQIFASNLFTAKVYKHYVSIPTDIEYCFSSKLKQTGSGSVGLLF